MQCSQQLRRTADEKFKIEAESYLSFTLCEEKQSMYSHNPLLFLRDHGNNFLTLQVLAGLFLGMSAGSVAVFYVTGLQQPAIKLITSNTAQVNFPA